MAQEVFGLCAVPSGAEADEPLQTRKTRHERVWTNVLKRIFKLEEGRVPDWNAKGSQQGKPFSHRRRGVTVKEREVVRESGRRSMSDNPF